MRVGPTQILLLSDSARTVASLEGQLAQGQFRLHQLSQPDQLDQRLAGLTATLDGAIVDGTAPAFSNGHLESTLAALDHHQLGAVLLTRGGPEAPSSAASDGGDSSGQPDTPIGFPLVWPLRADRLELLPSVLAVIAGYQQLIRQLHREIRLYQRLDSRVTGRFNELDEEMRLASRIQNDFLPKRLPAVGPAQFATLYRPASWVSGDIYDVFRLDETHVGFYIADAVGHGMPAALLTMFIKRSMETKRIAGTDYRLLGPDETLGSLNRALVEASLSASQFTTAVYAVLNVRTLQVEFARGGHPHPIRLHADGTTSEPEADGGLLGVFADARFACARVQLAPGDKLVLYSDGLEQIFAEGPAQAETDPATEKPAPEPPSEFRRQLQAVRDLPAKEMLERLVDQMDRQAGSLCPRDDATLVVLEISR